MPHTATAGRPIHRSTGSCRGRFAAYVGSTNTGSPSVVNRVDGVAAEWIAMETLKLVALDKEDLEIISAHLQDAVLKVSDVIWRPNEKRLVLGLNRFDWEAAQWDKPEYRRRRTALRFDCVKSSKCRHVDP